MDNDRWHRVLTVISEHDETKPQHRGNISGPIITQELCSRLDTGDDGLGPTLSILKALVRRGLVERASSETELKTPIENWGLGMYPWSWCWRLTEAGKDRDNWPTAPKLKSSKRRFPSSWDLITADREKRQSYEKVKLMPMGPERTAALEILVTIEREIELTRLNKQFTLARNPRRKAEAKAKLEAAERQWSEYEAKTEQQAKEIQEGEDELVRIGRRKPEPKLSVH